MQDWKILPKEHGVWKGWVCCLILQSLLLRGFALGGIDDSECDFLSISSSLIKEWICGTNLGCSHWLGMGSTRQGMHKQRWAGMLWGKVTDVKTEPMGRNFSSRFHLEFCHHLHSIPKDAKLWYRAVSTQPHPKIHSLAYKPWETLQEICEGPWKTPALHRTPTRVQLELSLFYYWINPRERQKMSEHSLCPVLGVHCFPNEWKCPPWCLSPV